MKLFEIFGEIKIDDEGAIKSLTDTDKQGSKTAKAFGKSAKAIGKSAKIAAVGVGAVATGLGVIITKTTNAAAEIDKFAQVTGMSTTSFQEWDFVMQKYGYTMEQASGDLAALGEKAMDAASGVGEGAELFEKLGVAVTDSSGKLKSQEEIFNDTITALQGMENATERNAIASALLSTTGEELVPILNMTKEELDGVKNSAHDMGAVMSEDAVNSGAMLKQTMNDLKSSVGGVFNEIGVMLMPIMQKMATWIIDNMPTIKRVAGDVFNYTKDAVMFLYYAFEQYLLPVFKSLFTWVGENMDTIKSVVSTAFEVIATAVSATWDMFRTYLLPVLKDLFNFVKDNWPAFQQVFETVFDAIKVVVSLAYDIFKEIFDIIKSLYYWASPAFPLFKDFIVTAFEGIVAAVQTGIDIFNGIKNAAEDAIEWIKDGLKWIGIMNDEGQPGGGGGSSWTSEDSIPNTGGVGTRQRLENLIDGFRANGGPVSSGSSYIVGETEPELFVPDQSGTIIPQSAMGSVTVNTMVVREEADINKIARELHNLQTQKRRGLAY